MDEPLGVLQAEGGETAADVIDALAPEWIQFPGYRLVVALLVIVLSVYLSKVLVRFLGRPIAQRFERGSVVRTILGGVRVLTIAVGVALAGSLLGLGIGDILLSTLVFSAVAGVILAPIVGNTINGVFVLADQPYEIGDMIELDDGTRGFVEDITIRYTKVFTVDNTFLVIPNGNMRERDVTNYSAEDERTRTTLDVIVTYESDVIEARRLMERAAKGVDAVVKGGPDIRIGTARYPARPQCLIADYGDDGILLRLRYWIQTPYKLPTVQSTVRTQIWRLFEDADVEIAYPHRHHIFDETSGRLPIELPNHDPASADSGTDLAEGESDGQNR